MRKSIGEHIGLCRHGAGIYRRPMASSVRSTFHSFRITDPVITSPAPPCGVSRPGATSSGDLCRAPQQLRQQLGDVGGDAPSLVAVNSR
jgi:hypothetical protein